MHRVVTGATGLIGKRLVEHWLKQHHTITVIGRTEEHIQKVFGTRVKACTWDHLSLDVLQSAEVVVNLAGASVGEKLWSVKRKQEILHSRVDASEKIADLLTKLGKKSPPLFNASAIGIYGLQKQTSDGLPPPFTENSPIDWNHAPDFLSSIGRQWEKAAQTPMGSEMRVVYLRFGVVLANEGGALPQLVKPFQFFLGSPIGTGRQPFSWIAIDDVIRAIDFLIANPSARGPYNIVSPKCINQRTLAKTIAKVLHRPCWFPIPGFVFKLVFGKQMARELLLEGQHVYPQRLLEAKFAFAHPEIEPALRYLLGQP